MAVLPLILVCPAVALSLWVMISDMLWPVDPADNSAHRAGFLSLTLTLTAYGGWLFLMLIGHLVTKHPDASKSNRP